MEEGRPLSPAPPAVAISGNRKPRAAGHLPFHREEQEEAGRLGLGLEGPGSPQRPLSHPHLLLLRSSDHTCAGDASWTCPGRTRHLPLASRVPFPWALPDSGSQETNRMWVPNVRGQCQSSTACPLPCGRGCPPRYLTGLLGRVPGPGGGESEMWEWADADPDPSFISVPTGGTRPLWGRRGTEPRVPPPSPRLGRSALETEQPGTR